MSDSAHRQQTPTPANPPPPQDPFLGDLDDSEVPLGESVADSDGTPTIISKAAPLPHPAAGLEAAHRNLRGQTLAHFELLEPIGVGGMAAVLRAKDTQLDRFVALKILPPDMAAEPENVRRFHQEARAAAKLDHENIARVFYCGEDQKLHFIAFEFVEGENLRTILERRGHLPVVEAVHYMLQIATGLAHAASRNVVHRDIKPSNIIITPGGRAKLVDMGLARSVERHDSNALTQSGVTLGTFDYISPEQALEPRDADVRSDIYSLGCTFYHALTGRPPVPDGTAARKLHHHQHVLPVHPRQLNPNIPDSVAVILARMMAKNPKDRYQRPEHLVQHLLQVAHELGAPAQVPEGLLYVDTPLPGPPVKRPGLLVGLAVAGLVALLTFLSFAPGDDVRPGAAAPPPVPGDAGPAVPAGPEAPRVEPGPRGPQEVAQVATWAKLQDALRGEEPARKVQITAPTLTLQVPLQQAAVNPRDPGREVVIEPADPTGFAELVVQYDPTAEPASADPVAALAVLAGRVQFERIRFRLEPASLAGDALAGVPGYTAAAVSVGGTARAAFRRCSFAHATLPWSAGPETTRPLAGVAVGPGAAPAGPMPAIPEVRLTESLFLGGHTAVAVTGPAQVSATGCAFGPHRCLFHIGGGGAAKSPPRVDLTACSAYVTHGPAFRIEAGTQCGIETAGCIFSTPNGRGIGEDRARRANLLEQTGPGPLTARYHDHGNCYQGLNYLLATERDRVQTLTDFAGMLPTYGGSADPRSQQPPLLDNPWQDTRTLQEVFPGLQAAAEFDAAQLRAPFQLKPGRRDLWLGESAGGQELVGTRACVWGPTYDDEPTPPAPDPAPPQAARNGPAVKIVDPSTTKPEAGVYNTIGAALSEAVSDDQPDDVILIRHDGLLPLKQTASLAGSERITIKPFPGCAPVLTLGKDTKDANFSLFEVKAGQLRLENLSFLLTPNVEPGANETASRSVVTLIGAGQCLFKNCLVTLQQENDVQLSAVRLKDVSTEMVGGADQKLPTSQVYLEDSLVRGTGTFLTAAQATPFKLHAARSLIALAGTAVRMNVDRANPSVSAEAEVHFTRTTTLLTDHLIHLVDRQSGKRLLKTSVDVSDSLFLAADGRSLLHLEVNGMDQRKPVLWIGSHNAYCGYDNLLEPQSSEGVAMPIESGSSNWQMFSGESSSDSNPEMRSRYHRAQVEPGVQLADLQPRDLLAELQKYDRALQAASKQPDNPLMSLVTYGAPLPDLQARLPFPPPAELEPELFFPFDFAPTPLEED